eukprot:4398481-Pyramimonas_sp.AAC.1
MGGNKQKSSAHVAPQRLASERGDSADTAERRKPENLFPRAGTACLMQNEERLQWKRAANDRAPRALLHTQREH